MTRARPVPACLWLLLACAADCGAAKADPVPALEAESREVDVPAMLELAVAKASLAIAADPDRAEAFGVRASAQFDLGRYDLGLADLREAALRDPRYAPVLRRYEQAAGQETDEDRSGAAGEPDAPVAGRAWAGPLAYLAVFLASVGALFAGFVRYKRTRPIPQRR